MITACGIYGKNARVKASMRTRLRLVMNRPMIEHEGEHHLQLSFRPAHFVRAFGITQSWGTYMFVSFHSSVALRSLARAISRSLCFSAISISLSGAAFAASI